MKAQWKEEFAGRLRKRESELQWLYCELYHNDRGAYDYFTDMLYRMWEERPEKLKAMDAARESCPDWYRGHELVGMQMYVKEFAGTLKGLQAKLDYIGECGVNCLHLMPLLKSPEGHSDGGYAVSDFRAVQPELGTMEDLENLAEACRDRGISLCLDFVLNHTSDEHEWAEKARAGEKEYQDRYFFFDDWTLPNAFEQTVPQVFPTTAPGNFTWCEEAHKAVMTTFHSYQWDLNYSNPTVFNDMTENLLYLSNKGVDILRLDATPYLWKALGTTCRNLPQVHSLVRMLRIACEIVCPGTLLLGEIVMAPDKVVPYFGTADRPECHLLYNVTTMATLWHTAATRDTRLMAHQIRQLAALPKEYVFLNYLRCHDDIGWGLDYGFLETLGQKQEPHKKFLNDYLTGKWGDSPARGELYNDDPRLGDARLCGTTASLCGIEAAREEEDDLMMEEAVELDRMLHAFLFTLSGIPVLYSGDEIAAENDHSYRKDPLKREDSRYLHRGRMDWEKAEKRHAEDTPEGRLFATVRRLAELHREQAVFDAAADVWVLDTGNDRILGIGRYYRKLQLLALFNFGAEDATAWLKDEKEYTDLMTGVTGDAGAVKVKAGGFRWLLHRFN